MAYSCTLSFLASPRDVPYLELTLSHLVRSCRFPFEEKILNCDITGEVGVEELRRCCHRLVASGVVDRVLEFQDDILGDERLAKRHFHRIPPAGRDCRGIPLWGWIAGLENCTTDYLLHFDCDMLLHQREGHCWITEGMDLLRARRDVICVLPLPGPPAPDGRLIQKRGVKTIKNGYNFYDFKTFTSRKFLVNCKRFYDLLPLKLSYVSRRARLRQFFTGKSALFNWERMVSRRLAETDYIRADLASSRAWSIHPVKHNGQFIEALPLLIDKIERGWFPKEQAGRYDLVLEAWI